MTRVLSLIAFMLAGVVMLLAFEIFALHQISSSLGQCAALMEGPRSSGEGASSGASLQPLPDGNHGENVLQGASL